MVTSLHDAVMLVRGRGYGIPAQTAASNTGSSNDNNAGAATLAMAAQTAVCLPTSSCYPDYANLCAYADLERDLTDEKLSQLSAVDPDPDTCTTSRFDFTEPVLHDRSINRGLTGFYDIRPYSPSPKRRLKFVEIVPEKSDTMEFR
ncbi:hypothetical protein SLS54_009515 [Diplodia seriata]